LAVPAKAARSMILPLALAQFIASYAATNMNVAITDIAKDLGTTVTGVQTAITLFTLMMAALMIPGSKLTDIRGRKLCFIAGLVVYGVGALLAAVSQGLGLMIFGYSVLEGIGSALLIPPIYILITVAFDDMRTRAKYFGIVSGAGGLGAATGPLIGGLVTTTISWRASFILQVLVVAWIIVLARKIVDPPRTGTPPRFDYLGAVLSGAGLFFVVIGILQSRTYGWGASREDFKIGDTVVIPKGSISPVWVLVAIGVVFLAWFYLHLRAAEKSGRPKLLATSLFHNRTSNLGLATQTAQWLIMQGSFFVVSVFLQEIRHFSAIKTGLMLTPATIGILAASALAERMAKRRTQRFLVSSGFVASTLGLVLLLVLARAHSGIWTFVPGLFIMGLGVGVMLTASVNVVQSSFSAAEQGDISGVSRSVSNLGSSLGTALAGSILVSTRFVGNHEFAGALATMAVFSLLGLVAALLLPRPGAARNATPARQ
jgi:MFS family permease